MTNKIKKKEAFSKIEDDFFKIDGNEQKINQENLNNWCTSYIFKNNKDKYYLISNLDLWFNPEVGTSIYLANYYKKGKLVAKVQEIFGVYGAQRAYSTQGKFAISMNKRNIKYDGLRGIEYFFFELTFYRNRPQLDVLLRDISISAKSYDEALLRFKHTPVMSPGYYIITGWSDSKKNPEGCVLERNIRKLDSLYCLDWENTDKSLNKWFLVQTNYDRDVPDPKKDYRRVPLENKIKAAGFNNMSFE